MADRDVLSIVWGETSKLIAKSNANTDQARLYAVICKLAAAAKRRGLDGKLCKANAPPADNKPALEAYQAMNATVNAVDAGTWRSATPLPARAVLWEVNDRGFPRRDRSLPAAASWIFDQDVVQGGDYVAGDDANQRTYRLFELEKVPADEDLPYVSDFTGSGIPPAAARRWYKNPNWWLGLSGATVFFLALLSLLWTASSFSQAYDLLAGHRPAQFVTFAEGVHVADCPADVATPAVLCLTQAASFIDDNLKPKKEADRQLAMQNRQRELNKIGVNCIDRLEIWGKAIKTPRSEDQHDGDLMCLGVLGQAVSYASRNLVIGSDNWVSSILQRAGMWLFGWHVPRLAVPTVSLGMPLTLMMAGVVVVLIALGTGFTGKPLGAIMSPQGRYSLALAQVTFWTVLVLTSLVAISVFNAGLVSEHLRELSLTDAAAVSIFPSIPPEIWAVLGITFVSPVLSSIIKGLKPAEGNTPELLVSSERPGVTFFRNTSGLAYLDETRASIADWFLGEEGANKDKIDISRVQMVLVTVGLLVTYGNEIFGYTRDILPAGIIAAIGKPSVLFEMLPPVGATMAVLLAMSHATYLVAKASAKRDNMT